MSDFTIAVEKLLKAEGGFAPRDNKAGAVHWGITSSFLRLIGEPCSVEDVRALTRERAISLYREYFWDRLRIGDIRDQRLAEMLLFAVVNMNPQIPMRHLQESLQQRGALNLRIDGIMGSQTLNAIHRLGPNEIKLLILALKTKLLARYETLARQNPEEYADDLAGWKARLEAV